MLDEGTLRERFPEIPWDQPVDLHVISGPSVWACRYCIALHGVKASLIIEGLQPGVYPRREAALDHIEAVHHD